MASSLNQRNLEKAFQGRPDLQEAIRRAAGTSTACCLLLQSLLAVSFLRHFLWSQLWYSNKQSWNRATDIHSAVTPAHIELFNEISLHVYNLLPVSSSEPASKKRRIDEGLASRPASNSANKTIDSPLNGSSNTAVGPVATANDPVLLEMKDISLVIPQRKKYTLCFTSLHVYARPPDSKEPVPGISYAWKDIGTLDSSACLRTLLK